MGERDLAWPGADSGREPFEAGERDAERGASYERAPLRARLGIGAAVVVLLLALGVTVFIGVLRPGAPPVTTVEPSAAAAAVDAAEEAVYVHVRGAVVSPGLHRLAPGARIVDAIAAAGGFADDADDAALNLARPVSDGDQVSVPRIGEEQDDSAAVSADGLVNLNTADEAALTTLPRIGPALAQRIIDWRNQNGSFTSVEQLAEVSGIGDKMLETLRPLVTT